MLLGKINVGTKHTDSLRSTRKSGNSIASTAHLGETG